MTRNYLISIERLHLIAGGSLVLAGAISYVDQGLETALSWAIFGAMYISMSDIGEDDMPDEKRGHMNHKLRRLFGYLGSGFSLYLVMHYTLRLLH